MRLSGKLRRLRRAEGGVVLILTALLFPILIGFAALAVDVGLSFVKREAMQLAADSAAFNGATSIAANLVNTTAPLSLRATACINEVNASARALGFVNGASGVTVTQTGCSAAEDIGGKIYVNVTITSTTMHPLIDAFFNLRGGAVSAILPRIWSPSVNAVARVTSSPPYCILALGHLEVTEAIYMSGNTTIQSPNCGIADNSTDSCALYASGSAEIDTPIAISGGFCGNAKVTGGLDLTYARPVTDPFANNTTLLADLGPSYPGGNGAHVSGTSPISLTPGHYDAIPSNKSLNLSPGTYYFDSIGNNAGVITGTGVTLIFPQNVSFPNNAPTFNVTPPSTDATSPFYGVSIASLSSGSTGSLDLYGGNNFSGSVYLPNASVTYHGNTTASCIQIVANIVKFTGSSIVRNDLATCVFFTNNQIKRTVVQLIQ